MKSLGKLFCWEHSATRYSWVDCFRINILFLEADGCVNDVEVTVTFDLMCFKNIENWYFLVKIKNCTFINKNGNGIVVYNKLYGILFWYFA